MTLNPQVSCSQAAGHQSTQEQQMQPQQQQQQGLLSVLAACGQQAGLRPALSAVGVGGWVTGGRRCMPRVNSKRIWLQQQQVGQCL